jgi:lycopene elongase/hydratase (dihydrobisanhydrobacterioruberin-forming)
MSETAFLLRISRPRFWFYTFGPYLIGLIAGAGRPEDLFFPAVAVFAFYFLLPANLLIYGVNDIFDYETDRINPKKDGYELLVGPDKRRPVLAAIAVTNSPVILLSATVFLTSYETNSLLIVLGAFLFLSIFYSAPPIRAKTKPFLDSAFNALYVMPGALAYVLVSREAPPAEVILAASCWTAAMHAYSAIPDIKADRTAGIHTIATVCGTYGTLAVCFLLYAAAAILSLPYLGIASITVGLAYLLLMLASVQSARMGRLFRLYRAFPIINVVAGFALFWTIAAAKFL